MAKKKAAKAKRSDNKKPKGAAAKKAAKASTGESKGAKKKTTKKPKQKATKKAAAAKKAARKAGKAKAKKAKPSAKTEEEVRVAAYLNYKARVERGEHGDPEGDWLAAEESMG